MVELQVVRNKRRDAKRLELNWLQRVGVEHGMVGQDGMGWEGRRKNMGLAEMMG